jgi:hypothetical protein
LAETEEKTKEAVKKKKGGNVTQERGNYSYRPHGLSEEQLKEIDSKVLYLRVRFAANLTCRLNFMRGIVKCGQENS